MAEITKEQWAQIAEELQGFSANVQFRYKGREIYIARCRTGESTYHLTVYVDGHIQGAWMIPDSEGFDETVAEVWFCKKTRLWSPAKVKKMEKEFGKRRLRKLMPNVDKVSLSYSPVFGSTRTLINQYKKLDGLILEGIGYQQVREARNARA